MATNVLTEEIAAHTRRVTVVTCDVCAKPTKGRFYKCYICGKDLCYLHAIYDPRDSGDYPDKYCSPCWDIGEPYRVKEAQLEATHEDELDKLRQAWKAAATKP